MLQSSTLPIYRIIYFLSISLIHLVVNNIEGGSIMFIFKLKNSSWIYIVHFSTLPGITIIVSPLNLKVDAGLFA